MRALAAHGQPTAMAQAAVATDVHQTLDVHLDALAQVALDLALRLDGLADAVQLPLVQIAHAHVGAHVRLLKYGGRARAPDAVDVRQSDSDPLVYGEVNADYTSHFSSIS